MSHHGRKEQAFKTPEHKKRSILQLYVYVSSLWAQGLLLDACRLCFARISRVDSPCDTGRVQVPRYCLIHNSSSSSSWSRQPCYLYTALASIRGGKPEECILWGYCSSSCLVSQRRDLNHRFAKGQSWAVMLNSPF
jgi:hypothetical protein